MDNNSFITAKLGWFTSEIQMDISYETDGSLSSTIQGYEEGSIKAFIAKLFKWISEDCFTTVGGRKIYVDKDTFSRWKMWNAGQINEQLHPQTVNEWVVACKMKNVRELSYRRLQELLEEGQLSQEVCNGVGTEIVSILSLNSVPLEQIEKLFRGNPEWIESNEALRSLVEINKISETLYPILKDKLLQDNEIWQVISPEQIAIFCQNEDFLNEISPEILQILLNNQKIGAENLRLINETQFKLLDFSALNTDAIKSLLFDIRLEEDRYHITAKEDMIKWISGTQIVEILGRFEDVELSIDERLFFRITSTIEKSIFQAIDLSRFSRSRLWDMCVLYPKKLSIGQVQHCVERKAFSIAAAKCLCPYMLKQVDLKSGCHTDFYLFMHYLTKVQINDLLIHCNLLIHDKYEDKFNEHIKGIKQVSGRLLKSLSPEAIRVNISLWTPTQISCFNKDQVAYLMESNLIGWQMLSHLNPEVLKEVERETLKEWLDLHTPDVRAFVYEQDNTDKLNRELLTEKQLEVVKSLNLNI